MNTGKKVLCIAIVLCYAAGLACMLLSNMAAGLILWTVSTLGGGSLLAHWRHQREAKELAEEVGARGRETDGDH